MARVCECLFKVKVIREFQLFLIAHWVSIAIIKSLFATKLKFMSYTINTVSISQLNNHSYSNFMHM